MIIEYLADTTSNLIMAAPSNIVLIYLHNLIQVHGNTTLCVRARHGSLMLRSGDIVDSDRQPPQGPTRDITMNKDGRVDLSLVTAG